MNQSEQLNRGLGTVSYGLFTVREMAAEDSNVVSDLLLEHGCWDTPDTKRRSSPLQSSETSNGNSPANIEILMSDVSNMPETRQKSLVVLQRTSPPG